MTLYIDKRRVNPNVRNNRKTSEQLHRIQQIYAYYGLACVTKYSLRFHNSRIVFEYNLAGAFVLFTRSDQRFRWRDIAAKVSDRQLIGELTVLLLPLFYQTRCEIASKYKRQLPRQVSRCIAQNTPILYLYPVRYLLLSHILWELKAKCANQQ